jgi:hypothetical protein
MMVREFLQGEKKIASACFGVAGPVIEGKVKATNLPWVIHEDSLKKDLGIKKAALINDLTANGYGIPLLKKKAFETLNAGKERKGNAALISAGTGLGEALLFWDGKGHIPSSSEGGHAEFAPRNRLEIELLEYLMDRFGHVSYERILSGTGLSHLYQFLRESKRFGKEAEWLARFPMWDWVGGRTSETSAVGLLPAALQGIDIDALLEGARLCDEATRRKEARANPSALMALMWYHATGGRGKKDMVILPYKNRLQLFPKYLQQLVMESLGKERDLDGKAVNQGIAVYGNKGSTDQHAYVQQLREGVNNFFVTFIEVLRDREGYSLHVDDGVTSGDYLNAFLQGTRRALFENGRESITITIERVDARSLGALIALYERAVGFYASFVNVNAYHQPSVETGKKAAGLVIQLQMEALNISSRKKR